MTSRAYIGRLSSSCYLDLMREGLDFVGAGQALNNQSRIFLKPNLTFPSYRPGVMTSIEAVEAAIVALKDYTPHIYVGDSDSGGYNPFSMHEVYRETGLVEFSKRYGVEVVNLSDLPRQAVPIRDGSRPLSVDLPILLTDEIDHLVTLPVPKIHMNTQVSLSYKNQWGCIPEPKDRLRLHPRFAEVIYAVNMAIHADFAIVDGRYGLNVSGPMLGEPIELDWLLVTNGIGAAARLCLELMQIPLGRVGHLQYAERRGSIPQRSEIKLNQELAPFMRARFYLRRHWTDYPGLLAFRSRPLAYLAYFSPAASLLHRLLYLFREPFYDYGKGKAPSSGRAPARFDHPPNERR
jgi:uncharacterized protein (DUF362 family)